MSTESDITKTIRDINSSGVMEKVATTGDDAKYQYALQYGIEGNHKLNPLQLAARAVAAHNTQSEKFTEKVNELNPSAKIVETMKLPETTTSKVSSESIVRSLLEWQERSIHALESARGLSRQEAIRAYDEVLFDRIVNGLITQVEDIPENYWITQKQIARDNGAGDIKLDSYMKNEMVKHIQDGQKSALETWTNYFISEGERYPQWYKLYAMNNVAKMGRFNKTEGVYEKRSNGTVAPYPMLNAAALASTYYEMKDNPTYAKNVNFNVAYSRCLLENNSTVKTPKDYRDVHGEWRDYTSDMVEELSKAAQGTPWCIANTYAADSYLKLGEFDPHWTEYEDRFYEEDGSRFVLFHLQDPETGVTSKTAAVSIRMWHGKVAEISGLKENQALEDSLLPTAMKKIAELPGGEDYLQSMRDKEHLIKIDHKLHLNNNDSLQDIAIEDIEFIFEFNRRIDLGFQMHARPDPRIKECRDYILDNLEMLPEGYGEYLVHNLFAKSEDRELKLECLKKLLLSDWNSNYLARLVMPDYADMPKEARIPYYDYPYALRVLLNYGKEIDLDFLNRSLDHYGRREVVDCFDDIGGTFSDGSRGEMNFRALAKMWSEENHTSLGDFYREKLDNILAKYNIDLVDVR